MPDLICLIPNHGYDTAGDVPVYVSWLNGIYYTSDEDQDTFKLATTLGGSTLVQYTETVTEGYVRQENETPTITVSGLDHLEGETVSVVSGGAFVGTFVVSNGSITLNEALTTYQVGLPYTMKVRTMRLSVPQDGNTVLTRIKRIHSTVVSYIRSLSGRAGQEYNGKEYLNDIDATFSTNRQDTGENDRLTSGGFSEDAYTTITSDEPLPFTVLSTVISFEIEERR